MSDEPLATSREAVLAENERLRAFARHLAWCHIYECRACDGYDAHSVHESLGGHAFVAKACNCGFEPTP